MQQDNETLTTLIAAQGRVEGKVDTIMDYIKQGHEDNEAWKTSHDDRLAHVERKSNLAAGALALIMFLVTPILTLWHFTSK